MRNSYIIGLLALLTIMSGCSNSSNTAMLDVSHIAVSMDGDHWSLMDNAGNIVCQDEFSQRPSAVIEDMFFVKQGNSYSLYKIDELKSHQIENCFQLRDYGFFNDGLCLVTFPGERISIINKSGEKEATLEPINGHEVVSCYTYFADGLILAKLDNDHYCYLNTKGDLAFDSEFTTAGPFSDGRAVVERNGRIEVINTSGQTEFEIDKEIKLKEHFFSLDSYHFERSKAEIEYCSSDTPDLTDVAFYHGYLFGKNKNEKLQIVINKNGEVTKLPSTVHYVEAFNGTHLIFQNDNWDYGVLDINTLDVVIRCKYESIQFVDQESFLVESDDYYSVVNLKDEEQCQISDYEKVEAATYGFGIFAYKNWKDSKILSFDKTGNVISKVDFENFECFIPSWVQSDYSGIDYKVLCDNIVSHVNATGCDQYKLGATPYECGQSVSNNVQPAKVDVGLIHESPSFNISCSLLFCKNAEAAKNLTLNGIVLSIFSDKPIGQTGYGLLCNAFVNQGYKMESKYVPKSDELGAILTKGDILVYIESTALAPKAGYSSFNVFVVNNKAEYIEYIEWVIYARDLVASENCDVAVIDLPVGLPKEVDTWERR